jgi:hypothetical protein
MGMGHTDAYYAKMKMRLIDHLFVHCSFAKVEWMEITQGLRVMKDGIGHLSLSAYSIG